MDSSLFHTTLYLKSDGGSTKHVYPFPAILISLYPSLSFSNIILTLKKPSSQTPSSEMGRAPCCDKANVKKGPWSQEEDARLKSYIEQHGPGGNWIALPQKIGTY